MNSRSDWAPYPIPLKNREAAYYRCTAAKIPDSSGHINGIQDIPPRLLSAFRF
jgi:hypothetical protein